MLENTHMLIDAISVFAGVADGAALLALCATVVCHRLAQRLAASGAVC